MENVKPVVMCAVCDKPGAYLWDLEVGERKLPVHRGCGDVAKALAPNGENPRVRPSEWKIRTGREGAARNFWVEKFKTAKEAAFQKAPAPRYP